MQGPRSAPRATRSSRPSPRRPMPWLQPFPRSVPLQGRSGRRERRSMVRSHRLVTLTGAGGTGKTRVAVRVAADLLAEHTDGAFFVDLAPIRDPVLIPLAIARALSARVDPGGDALTAVRAHL